MSSARKALAAPVAAIRSSFAALDVHAAGELDTPLRISEENAAIILFNLADNAMRHGGTTRLNDSDAGASFELTIPIADAALS